MPPFLRETKRTKIIAGVWFGTNQPTSDILFSELLSNVQNLEISIRPNDENICLKAKLHVAQGDLPFKAKMLDMKSHKGFFCCPYCLIRGKLFLKQKHISTMDKSLWKKLKVLILNLRTSS